MLEEDLQILIEQTDIPRDLAKKLLIHKNGDLVESILEFNNYNNLDELEVYLKNENDKIVHVNDDAEKPVDTSIKSNLEEYREIVDEKDIIYNNKKKANEKKKKEAQEKYLKGETEETEKPMCNESIYYATRNNNINNIKVL